MVETHYHVCTVHGYTIRGHWRYLEHDWIAKPGTYIYEPAGEAHTLVITEDSPEPMVAVFVVEGGLLSRSRAGRESAGRDGPLTRPSTVLDGRLHPPQHAEPDLIAVALSVVSDQFPVRQTDLVF